MIIVLSPGNIYNVNQLYIGRLELGPKIYIMLDLQGVYQLRCPSSKGNASMYLYVNNTRTGRALRCAHTFSVHPWRFTWVVDSTIE